MSLPSSGVRRKMRPRRKRPVTAGSFDQSTFFDPQFIDPDSASRGSIFWLFANFRDQLIPSAALDGWRVAGSRGRRAWPGEVLATLWLLRWTSTGMSRRASCCTAKHDTRWRAAMGLPMGGPTPCEKTMRVFEKFLDERHPEFEISRAQMLHERWAALAIRTADDGGSPVWGIDSTAMHCYGASLDTIRLLGDGLRRLTRTWARASRRPVSAVTADWGLEPLMSAKSTKGAFDIDWRIEELRDGVVDTLAVWVLDAVDRVRRQVGHVRSRLRRTLLTQASTLMRVIRENLGTDDNGRYSVVRKVVRDRLVSLTDTEARWGHKSKSRKWIGYKAHVLGDVTSGVIVSCSATPATSGDGSPVYAMVRRARRVVEHLGVLLGDTAYTGAQLRTVLRGTEDTIVVAPPIASSLVRPSDKLVKNDFKYDGKSRTAECINGVKTDNIVFHKRIGKARAPVAKWSTETCNKCPFESACPTISDRGEHGVKFHPFEAELRKSLDAWSKPTTRTKYRRRAEIERLVHNVTRRGARQARSFGLRAANLQLLAIVAANNLSILAARLALEEEPSIAG